MGVRENPQKRGKGQRIWKEGEPRTGSPDPLHLLAGSALLSSLAQLPGRKSQVHAGGKTGSDFALLKS